MESREYWKLFMETGAPEYYLLYQHAMKQEAPHVSDDPGHCPQGNGLQ